LTILDSLRSMTNAYLEDRFAFACADATDFRGTLGRLNSQEYFMVVDDFIRGLDELYPHDSIVRMIDDHHSAEVMIIKLFVPALDRRVKFVMKTAADAWEADLDADESTHGQAKIYKDRMVSAVCVNFISFSRGVSRFWVQSYGSLSCSDPDLGANGEFDIAAQKMKCTVLDEDPAVVDIMNYVGYSMTLWDFIKVTEMSMASLKLTDIYEDIEIILQILFLNMQIALESCGFVHSNLHPTNILIQTTGRKETYSIAYASSMYTFRTRFIPVIIDYDSSVSCMPYDNATLVETHGRIGEKNHRFSYPGYGRIGEKNRRFSYPGYECLEMLNLFTITKFDIMPIMRAALDTCPEHTRRALLLFYANNYDLKRVPVTRDTAPALAMAPIEFMLNMNRSSEAASVDSSRYYDHGRTYVIDQSVVFWTRRSTLDALHEIHRDASLQTTVSYLEECIRKILLIPPQYGLQTEEKVSISDSDLDDAMAAWDDYYLLRYLQQDVLHCPGLLGALDRHVSTADARMIDTLSKAASHISTMDHVVAWQRAYSVVIAGDPSEGVYSV